MTAPIFKVCSDDPGVLAELGSSPTRLFPFGEAPEGVAKPYAVWQVIDGAPENYLAGSPDLDGFTIQVDVYAQTGASAREAAYAIRDAVQLVSYISRWGGETRDSETKNYRVSFDIEWLVPR